MHRSKEEIQKKINDLYNKLLDIAMQDSVITTDEHGILNAIKKDLDNLNNQVLQILEDDLEEHEFVDIVSQILEDTINNAQRVAEADELVSYDEKKILDSLREFVESEEIFK